MPRIISLIITFWKFDILKTSLFALEVSLLEQIFVIIFTGQVSADSSSTKTLYFISMLLQWDFIDIYAFSYSTGCGSVVNNTLKSPGFPGSYASLMYCNYTVPVPRNMTLKISFINFYLEDDPTCRWAYGCDFDINIVPRIHSWTLSMSFGLDRLHQHLW